jgi:outer membrane lipoprotein-sorting protein
MKKIIGTLALVLLAWPAVHAADSDIFSYIPFKSASWVSSISMDNGSTKQDFVQNVSYKAGKMRMEGKMMDQSAGTPVNQLMIISNRTMFIIDTAKKSGTKFSMNNSLSPENYTEETAKFRKNAEKTGSEMVNGVECDIFSYDYTFKDGAEPTHMKEWRSNDGFIWKSTSENNGTKTTSTVTELKKNPDLDDSLFSPSKDIKILDMDEMMKSMGSSAQKGQGSDATDGNGADDDHAVKSGSVESKNLLKTMFGQ